MKTTLTIKDIKSYLVILECLTNLKFNYEASLENITLDNGYLIDMIKYFIDKECELKTSIIKVLADNLRKNLINDNQKK